MSKPNSLALAILRWPLVWGCLASLGFYALIQQGVLQGDFVQRYFASHPVEYIAMTMFFVGLAALAIKMLDVALQSAGLHQTLLGPSPEGGQAIAEVGLLVQRVRELHGQQSYLVGRLRDALEYVRRKGSADMLDEHLRYASDVDLGRMHASYSLVRIIIWAIPILGFLGTVVGITLAIAKLGPQDLENSLPEVVNGLKVAFDTTALALALSIVLMFAQFIADRMETRLLTAVDARVAAELVGRFEQYGGANDPQAAAVKRMADAVLKGVERLVGRQVELWQESIQAAERHWQQSAQTLGTQLAGALDGALRSSLEHHAQTLVETEQAAVRQHQEHWQEAQQAILRSAAMVVKQHEELVRQGDLLKQVVAATGQIQELETSLNSNLAALAESHHFEETAMSLAAAIQLLTAQMHHGPSGRSFVELHTKKASTNAA